MIQIESQLEGKSYNLHKLEQLMKPMGYVIGGNWDYDRGFFDYKMADDNGYQFLRIPFTAVEGQLDKRGTIVSFGRPFVLSHVYQDGLNEQAQTGNLGGAFNQFSDPLDPDGEVDDKYVSGGKKLIQQLERVLSSQ